MLTIDTIPLNQLLYYSSISKSNMQVKSLKNIVFFKKIIYNKIVYGGVFGFDSTIEVLIASSGFSLGHFNHVREKINADNNELALAA